MAVKTLSKDEELLALFNAYRTILEMMVSHDLAKVDQAADAIRYLRWHCRGERPSDRVVRHLAETAPVQTPEAAAAALAAMRERLAMLDAILTSAVHEAQDLNGR